MLSYLFAEWVYMPYTLTKSPHVKAVGSCLLKAVLGSEPAISWCSLFSTASSVCNIYSGASQALDPTHVLRNYCVLHSENGMQHMCFRAVLILMTFIKLQPNSNQRGNIHTTTGQAGFYNDISFRAGSGGRVFKEQHWSLPHQRYHHCPLCKFLLHNNPHRTDGAV